MVVTRIANSLVILLGIAFLTLLGLYMAQQGRKGLPANLLGGSLEALRQLIDYLLHHPQAYVWHKEIVPAAQLVWTVFRNSAGLLLVSLAIAATLGISLGILAAQMRNRKSVAPLMVVVSLVGVSAPTFLFGVFLWAFNVQLMRMLGITRAPLPQIGFGWDKHLIMPALVLAARPFAQIMQVTYVNLSKVLDAEFIRAARGKGLPERILLYRHAIRNVEIPILTTLSTSLRFSLASLVVVESFFYWPGIGLSILQAIQMEITPLVVDLVVSLGVLFLLINLAVEFLYPLIDPRLKENGDTPRDELTWGDSILSALSGFGSRLAALRAWFARLLRGDLVRDHRPRAAAASVSGAVTVSLPAVTAGRPGSVQVRFRRALFSPAFSGTFTQKAGRRDPLRLQHPPDPEGCPHQPGAGTRLFARARPAGHGGFRQVLDRRRPLPVARCDDDRRQNLGPTLPAFELLPLGQRRGWPRRDGPGAGRRAPDPGARPVRYDRPRVGGRLARFAGRLVAALVAR